MRNTDRRRAGYLAAVRAGLAHTAAAQAAGVDRSTARRWRADPHFALQLRDAQAAADAAMQADVAARIAALRATQQLKLSFVYTAPPSAWTPAKRAAARARAAAYWTPERRAQAREEARIATLRRYQRKV